MKSLLPVKVNLPTPVRAEGQAGRTPVLQAKLSVNEPGDPYEQEADTVAGEIMGMGEGQGKGSLPLRGQPPQVQRKCAECEKEEEERQVQRKCAKCEDEEKEEHVHRKEAGGEGSEPNRQRAPVATSAVDETLKAPGQPLDPATRDFMESRFGHDFGRVRIHDDAKAADSARGINALAYTSQHNIVFSAGQYAPRTDNGKRLLAHELTHVLQQRGSDRVIRRKTGGPGVSKQSTRFIVDDGEPATEGRMQKSVFLRTLNERVCEAVDRALKGTKYSSDNCPYIKSAFARHAGSSAAELEQLLMRYAPSSGAAKDAANFIYRLLSRAHQAVEFWKQTGELPDLPLEAQQEIAASVPRSAKRKDRLSFKANAGGANAGRSPEGVMDSLGKGRPMDSAVRSRMEGAFGTNFSDVEIHSDSHAAGLNRDMNARAFAVGNHIAFASGEYRPGTLIGDALMAHELAHVVQQGQWMSGSSDASAGVETSRLEEDADVSAVRAVLSGYGGVKGAKGDIAKAMPRLRSGLSLQRCQGVALAGFLEMSAASAPVVAETAPIALVEGTGVAAAGTATVEVSGALATTTAVEAPAVATTITSAAAPATAAVETTATASTIGTAAKVTTGVAAASQLSGGPAGEQEQDQKKRKTCAEVYPGVIDCDRLYAYTFASGRAAFEFIRVAEGNAKDLRMEKPAPAMSGPCPGEGSHTAVKRGGRYVASIVGCPCCSDTPAGPVLTWKYRVLWH